jgi:hypothetical protein
MALYGDGEAITMDKQLETALELMFPAQFKSEL